MEEDGGVQTGGGDVDDELSTPEKQRHDITGDITEDVKLSHSVRYNYSPFCFHGDNEG